MPSITFLATSNKNLKPVEDRYGVAINKQGDVNDPLRRTTAFQSICDGKASIRGSLEPNLRTTHSGLTGTIVEAYNTHKNLQLRPDDVWVAILCQFSAYVNGGRAETLRQKFVSHDGKKQLVVSDVGNIFTADFGRMTCAMLDEITKNINDPSLREWFLPGFSTSTAVDDVCASATAMCTLQAYFDYTFELCCGIPEVTLLGTVDDWVLLRGKIERLLGFDTDEKLLEKWVAYLRIICDNFVESAKNGSKNNLDFWDTVAHRHGGGSGPRYLSGWVAVFSFFNHKGERTRTTKNYTNGIWPVVNSNDVNPNVVSCPISVDDNGVKYDGRLFVGQMAYEVEKEGGPVPPCMATDTQEMHKLKPRNDWGLAITPKGD